MTATITKFKDPASAGAPLTDDLDGWKKVKGHPTMKTWITHNAPDGTMMSGIWEATEGTYHATYSAFEFVHLIEGEIVITQDGGAPVTVTAGDAFCVEKEFAGTWEIKKKVLKHWTFRLK
jgi:uncharacterized protein